ncbi:dynein regulatory complex subunit 7 [Agrilus planipennis]|uniref:Dynein regulatory complex subunit 7 n=1 Tax=Agrilus planipennis TaxID=224129 RepID=A0A1W4X8L2_AGRPL|nr:dynein regulatory complex subunit 7 [Agrilus planipennis]
MVDIDLWKMVCTTIRATSLPYPEIQSWKEIAKFVGDYVDYEELENPIQIPPRLYSPNTVFLRHSGHSFEIATALASLLLGFNYNAYVVSGYATEDVAKRIMMRVDSPFPEFIEQEEVAEEIKVEGKYALKPVRDLRSKFLLWLEQREIDKIKEKERKLEEERKRKIEEMEKPPHDDLYGWRVHGWVLVLRGREIETPMFIEPSTGYSHPIDSPLYVWIESIWNNTNYWVNMQENSEGIGSIDYDFTNTENWEHLLIGEPISFRQLDLPADMDEIEKETAMILTEKHLDVPPPWSSMIDIPHKVFRRRFPRGKKETMYKRTIVEEFSDHAQVNGMVTKIYRFNDLDCSPSELRTIEELYEHRDDSMVKIIRDCNSDWVTEYFRDGREDCCKLHSYHTKSNILESERSIEYYHHIRHDCLSKLEIGENYITEHFIGREDKFYYRHTVFAKKGQPPPGMLESRRRLVTITDFIKLRFKEIARPKLIVSLFDRDFNDELMMGMREQEKKQQEIKVKQLSEEVDYLYPYLARIGFPSKLSKILAEKVRNQCLSDFKQLLLRRINQVQKDYEKTKSEIEEKQKRFAAIQDTFSLTEEEDFYSALNDLFFYARCLEIRLQRYKELSPYRYEALASYLDLHPALAILRT